MKRLYGNLAGLKASQIAGLEDIYNLRVSPQYLVSPEIANALSGLSHEIRRQIGVLVNRQGKVASVIVGDYHGIVLPEISEYRSAPGRLKGIRCIHTHLKGEPLSHDDLTDLSLLRLDMMAVLTLTPEGRPLEIMAAHILPSGSAGVPYRILPAFPADRLEMGCLDLIQAIESELGQAGTSRESGQGRERALLISVSTLSKKTAMDSLNELEELAGSCGIFVVDMVFQHRRQADPRFLLGIGKLQEIALLAIQKGADLIIFDQELNPSQIRSITDQTEMKVIDRTQLILDIFAQRARSREGKLQVELAQLKYLLPRLVTKNTAMSRLTGGIGGRGPGETKLEINRRRARDRIVRLEKALAEVVQQRKQQKARRSKQGLPVISIIGYTNAGKSTLLNTLTQSRVLAEQRLFATLDPSSRRLRFPRDIDVIITDTVGFIKNLPQDLQVAFRATLEELETADLLLHVIDISNPRCEDQIQSVEAILESLALNQIPCLRVLNKQDALPRKDVQRCLNIYGGIAISANDKASLPPLIEAMALSLIRDKKVDIRCKGHISKKYEMNLERIKTVGIGAAYNGGRILQSFLGKIKTPDHKGAIDLVTEADLGSEKVIIEAIHKVFPDHAILAEESGVSGENPERRWIIDPLDGTTNYTHQLGLFGVSIAFELVGKIAVGIVLNPVTGELFTAVQGKGAQLNGKPIHVSATGLVSESLLVTGFPYNFNEIFREVMLRFSNCQRVSQGVRRLGSASLDLCFLACGRFEGYWEQNLKPWDTAAGCLIAREAGAQITDFSNRDYSIYGNEILATNGRIHMDMLELLKDDA